MNELLKLFPENLYKGEGGILLNMDCLEAMPRLPDGCIDLILADVPYGTTACKWDSIIPLEPMWKQLKRIIKPNGAIVMTASQPFTTTLIVSNMDMFKYEWIWDKKMTSGFIYSKFQPMRSHENIVVFYKNKSNYYPQMVERTEDELKRLSKKSVITKSSIEHFGGLPALSPNREKNKFKYPKSIIKITGVMNRSREKTIHPTQKPVALMEYLIKTYSNKGELVLDFTVGSGTTCVAAVNTGRRFIGIDTSAKYIEICQQRLAQEVLDL